MATIPRKPTPASEAEMEAFIGGAKAEAHIVKPAAGAAPVADAPVKKKRGKKEMVTRQTFVLNQELVDKFEAYVWWNRTTKKAVLESLLKGFLADKKVKSIPRDAFQSE